MKIVSIILLIVTVALNLKHFWDGFHIDQSPQALKMMTDLGITKNYLPFFNGLLLLVVVLVLFPRTFFYGNLLNAVVILLVMALALKAGNYQVALIEIPFLIIPLVMINLKYPFTLQFQKI